MTEDPRPAIEGHYSSGRLLATIEAALLRRGLDPARLAPSDLDFADHFHTGSKEATLDLAGLAALTRGLEVLDIGGGTGGPARTLAAEFGCHVTVVDLTEEFCRVGEELANRVGLRDSVVFRHGNALDLPFPPGSFDLAWSMQSSMNIPDKPRLYVGVHRVLRPGGKLAIQEIMAGPGGQVRYPTFFAQNAATSFLLTAEEHGRAIRDAGFRELAWRDVSTAYTSVPPASLGEMIHGGAAAEMRSNTRLNLEERRYVIIQAAFQQI